jgi:hypothetical protein
VLLINGPKRGYSPPLSWYSRKATVVLPDIPRRQTAEGDAEKGQTHEDNLDRHVEDVLSKRDQWRRIMSGVWAFMKTRQCTSRKVPIYHANSMDIQLWA